MPHDSWQRQARVRPGRARSSLDAVSPCATCAGSLWRPPARSASGHPGSSRAQSQVTRPPSKNVSLKGSTDMSRLYGAQHRALQEAFGTRNMADRIEQLACKTEFDEE